MCYGNNPHPTNWIAGRYFGANMQDVGELDKYHHIYKTTEDREVRAPRFFRKEGRWPTRAELNAVRKAKKRKCGL